MSTGSKRKMFGVASQTNEAISRKLSALSTPGAAFTPVDLVRIDPDPENPRWLELDLHNPRNIAEDDPRREEKLSEVEQIEDLALSITSQGVLTPINVYRVGDRFRIAQGERRFRASVLAGKTSIPAIVLKERPESLRLQQFIENHQRRGLSLSLKVRNLEALVAESREQGADITSADQLRELTGLGRTQAFDFTTILTADEDVRSAVASGKLTELKQAAKIARIENPEERRAAIERANSVAPLPSPERPKTKEAARGRPVTYVRFGKSPHTDVARRLIEAVAGKDRFKNTDWTSPEAVSAVFKKLIADMERGAL